MAASPTTAGHPPASATRPALSSVRAPVEDVLDLIDGLMASAVCGISSTSPSRMLLRPDPRRPTRARDDEPNGRASRRSSRRTPPKRPTLPGVGSRRSRSSRRRAMRPRSSASISARSVASRCGILGRREPLEKPAPGPGQSRPQPRRERARRLRRRPRAVPRETSRPTRSSRSRPLLGERRLAVSRTPRRAGGRARLTGRGRGSTAGAR